MKSTIVKSAFFIALATGLFSSCVQDDYGTPTLSECTETSLVKNREVSDIIFTTNVTMHQSITQGVSDVIEAYVTSSDIGGNFFKSISFQTLDGTKAFSIPVDASNTFIDYEPGRKVLINLDSLYIDSPTTSGAIGTRIGGLYANSSGGAEVGRMTETAFRKSVQPSCTIVPESDLAKHVTIAEAKSDYYLNKLIVLDNVQFDAISAASTYYDANNAQGGATNRNLIDKDGNNVYFRTSAYANFAAKPVPDGSGSVTGVMTKYNGDYQFLARAEKDVQLTNPRFYTPLNSTFSAGFEGWKGYSVTGAEVWAYSSTFGNPGGMVKMSGFAGGNKVNEDWLISPSQDLTSLSNGAKFSFDNAYKFDGAPIQVLISSDYDGTSNPTTQGTWTPLSGATLSSGNYVYANSGLLDISGYTGTATGSNHVYIAFKYTSSATAASTWEVDNVKITPNN